MMLRGERRTKTNMTNMTMRIMTKKRSEVERKGRRANVSVG